MSKESKIVFFETVNGDSSIVQLYDHNTEEYINILFDMGKKNNNIIDEVNKIKIHGIVITHIDEDHIYGIIELLKNKEFKKNNELLFIVFNEYNKSLISYQQGNLLKYLIGSDYSKVILLNSYENDYAYVNSRLKAPIKFLSIEKRDLFADLKMKKDRILITFLAPNKDDLKRLMVEWEKHNEGIKSSRAGKVTNQSSIVCFIEYKDINILMTGDQSIMSIYPILKDKKDIWNIGKIDCIKISHHASTQSNEGLIDIAEMFECKKMFFMTYHATDSSELSKKLEENGIQVYKGSEGKEEIEL